MNPELPVKVIQKTTKTPLSRMIKEIGRDAYLDWLTIVILTVVVLVVLVIGSIYLYSAVTLGRIQYKTETSSSQSQSYDRKALADMIKTLDEKDLRVEQAKRGYAGLPDPSQ